MKCAKHNTSRCFVSVFCRRLLFKCLCDVATRYFNYNVFIFIYSVSSWPERLFSQFSSVACQDTTRFTPALTVCKLFLWRLFGCRHFTTRLYILLFNKLQFLWYIWSTVPCCVSWHRTIVTVCWLVISSPSGGLRVAPVKRVIHFEPVHVRHKVSPTGLSSCFT